MNFASNVGPLDTYHKSEGEDTTYVIRNPEHFLLVPCLTFYTLSLRKKYVAFSSNPASHIQTYLTLLIACKNQSKMNDPLI